MKLSHLSITITASIATMSVAYAGGLERSTQSVAPLFEKGNYAEISAAYVDPNMKAGDGYKNEPKELRRNNNEMLEPYSMLGAAVKQDISDTTSIATFYSQPWGVSTKYPDTSRVFSNANGVTEAKLASDAFGVAVKQKLSDNFSMYGGVDYHRVSGFVNVHQPLSAKQATGAVLQKAGVSQAQYEQLTQGAAANALTTEQQGKLNEINGAIAGTQNGGFNYKLGYKPDSTVVPMLGMMYEKPEIALRASATYRAPAHLKLLNTEVFNGGTPIAGEMDISMPQSLSLDFQTGLSKKHQLLGKASARWVDWSNFKVAPKAITAQTGEPLASYDDDQYSFELGLAKQFTPKLAGEVSVSYDHADNKKPLAALGPNGATTGIGVGVQYDVNKNISLSGGAQYLMIDGGKVKDSKGRGLLAVQPSNGYAVGMKAAYKF